MVLLQLKFNASFQATSRFRLLLVGTVAMSTAEMWLPCVKLLVWKKVTGQIFGRQCDVYIMS